MSYVDRTNVGQSNVFNHINADAEPHAGNARLFSAEEDLNMSAQQWNTALAVFFVTYSLGGVPSNICLQRFGPKIWLPTIMLCVSITIICASLQSTFAGWTAFRVLLGLVEAGVFPGCSAVLTTWYSPNEVHTRMTIFYTGASAAGAFSGLLAYGIGQLDGTWGYSGWRWIFCLEGAFRRPLCKNYADNHRLRMLHCSAIDCCLLASPRQASQSFLADSGGEAIPGIAAQVLCRRRDWSR